MSKILVVLSERITGLNYHRQVIPFKTLQGFEILYTRKLTLEDIKAGGCDQFDCVSFLRNINLQGQTEEIVSELHKRGIKVHLDIDDYWVLNTAHGMYRQYQEQKVAQQTISALKLADFVTTTTDKLASVIQQHNSNVYVLPNAINPNEEQWTNATVNSDKLRFGYIAGVFHEKDAELLYDNFNLLHFDSDCKDKYQLCAAGFNLNRIGDKDYANPYYKYIEQLFTNKYKHVTPEYKEYLEKHTPEGNFDYNEGYRRLWGMDTFNYGKQYNFIDVSLIPLNQSLFTSCKSQLKVIEAGFMRKACIVSNVMPYTYDCTEENSLLIEPNRNGRGWYKAMRKMILNPVMASELGEAMYQTVKDKYHIDTVNVVRKQVFEKWLA